VYGVSIDIEESKRWVTHCGERTALPFALPEHGGGVAYFECVQGRQAAGCHLLEVNPAWENLTGLRMSSGVK